MPYTSLTNEQALLLNKYTPWADKVDLAALMDEVLSSARLGIFDSLTTNLDIICGRDLYVTRDAFIGRELQVGGGYGTTGVTVDTNGNLYADGVGDFSTAGLRTVATTVPHNNSTGTKGDVCFDLSYIYVCVATDSWMRVAFTPGAW